MRTLVKLLAVSLIGMLLLTSLIGCRPRVQVPDKPTKLVIWEVAEQAENVRKLAALFTAQHGIAVEVVELPNLEQRNQLALDGPAGIAADVVTWPHDQIGPAVLAGVIQPISEWLTRGVKDNFFAAALNAMTFEGELYGLPKAIETSALVYNKDLIASPPTTWEQLVALAEQHTNRADNRFGLLFDYRNFYFVHGIFAGMGAHVFKFADGKYDIADIGLNNAGAVAAMGLIKDLIDKRLLPIATDYQQMDGQFAMGRTAMIINGPWAIRNYRERGINVGVAVLPKLPNGRHQASFSGVKGWYLSAFTKHPYWATKLIEFITSKSSLESRFADTGEIPPRKDINIADPIAAGFLAQAEFAIPMPNVPEMGPVWGAVSAAIEVVARDNVPAQKALDDAVRHIRDAIAEMK
jgi:arabinogalactan oligomer/maltooligosaccharide transport system substrate-binding protein